MQKQSRLILFINGIYTLLKVSCLFWLSLIKRGFVYGWCDAFRAGLDMYSCQHPYDASLREYLCKRGKKEMLDQVLSALSTFFFLMILVSWFALLRGYSSLALLLFLVSVLAWIALLIVLFFYLQLKQQSPALRLYQSLKQLFQQLNDVAVLGTILAFLIFVALTKNILVWFVLPGVYCLVCVKLSLRNKDKEVNA